MKWKNRFIISVCFCLIIGLSLTACQQNDCGIKINYVVGGTAYGTVFCFSPLEYGVAVYIKVRDNWWTKPLWIEPVTHINCIFWSCDITTGGVDEEATEVAAFLIPLDYDPPSLDGDANLPQELYGNAVDYVTVNISTE